MTEKLPYELIESRDGFELRHYPRHVVAEVNILRELKHPFIVRYYDRIIDKAATRLYIVMEHCDSKERPKLKKQCRFPLTGQRCVDWVVTDLALLRWNDHDSRFELLETAPGFSVEEVVALTEMPVFPVAAVGTMA